MANVHECEFRPQFRLELVQLIKLYGIERAEKHLVKFGLTPIVAKALIRNTIRKYGW